MSAATPIRDVFVSYRRGARDAKWTWQVLVPALDSANVEMVIDDRDFELGVSIIENMATAVETTRLLLAVMSPAYFDSEFTTLERLMAQHLGLEEGSRRMIGLMLEPCEVPTELRPFLWLDVTGVRSSDDPTLDRLVRTIVQTRDDAPSG